VASFSSGLEIDVLREQGYVHSLKRAFNCSSNMLHLFSEGIQHAFSLTEAFHGVSMALQVTVGIISRLRKPHNSIFIIHNHILLKMGLSNFCYRNSVTK
jgi:hypothetical protein